MRRPGFSRFVDYAPGTPFQNKDLPLADETIGPKTGIYSRNIAGDNETVASMAIEAVRKLFDTLNIKGKDCSGLVLSTCTGHKSGQDISIDAAREVANNMGIQGKVYGVNAACSGFPAAVEKALDVARETDRHIVIVASEIFSRIVNWADKGTATLFADRAAAVSIINGGHQILDARAWEISDPEELIDIRYYEAVMNVGKQSNSGHCIHMNGLPLYKRGPGDMVALMEDSMEKLKVAPGEISAIVPHQANGRFMDKIKSMLLEKNEGAWRGLWVANEIVDRGNVGSASIPSALAQIQDNLLPGKIVICPAIGAGPAFQRGKLTQGVVSFRMSSEQG